jgi:4-amino-4-deoxy-L-arabinose transferase-like glycosyltransferase
MNRLAADPRGTLALVLAALVAWRLLAAADARLNLSIDEAQYFLWSLEPAWGYFSKPPMIAWTIAATTYVCGDSEACIRLPATLLFAASAWIVAALTERLYDARIGLWAGIAFAMLFLTSFYSWVMTTDAILLFFWSLALFLFLRALASDRWRDWLGLGICVGLGLLTKYSMGLFLGCALLVLWIDHRPRLASPKPWLAAFLACAFLIPNLAWNFTHDFSTLRHTAEISQLDRDLFHPGSLAAFVAAQFGVMGPLLFAALLGSSADRTAWRADARYRLIGLFALPVLALFILLSLLSRAHANWAAPAYVAATTLAVVWLLRHGRQRWLIAALALNLILAATLYHWHRIAPGIGIELRKGTDPFYPVRGWNTAGMELAQSLRASGCRAVLASDRGTLVELAYYGGRALGEKVPPLAYTERPDPQPFRTHRRHCPEIVDCAILVGNFDETDLRREFTEVEPLGELAAPTGLLGRGA